VSEAYGGHRLLSARAPERAHVFRWLFWEAAHWQPALVEALAPTVAHALFPDRAPAPEAPVDWHGEDLRRVVSPLEEQLAAQPFVAGPELTLADLSVAGMTTYFRAAAFPFDDFPALHAWQDRIESLPAWRETEEGPWRAAR
jgi:glutathione S-transferase